ncbi:MAG: hypothetical protein ABI221_00545 [Candidatus Saccharimonadales bacterium]
MAKNSNNTKTTIELNGKLYDALTGRPVDANEPANNAVVQPAALAAAPAPTPASPGRNVDGFFKASSAPANPARPVSPVASPPSSTPVTVPAPAVPSASRNNGDQSIQKRTVEKSQTLMRSAVSVPQTDSQPAAVQISSASSSQSPTEASAPVSGNLIDPNSKLQERLERASQVPRSSAVQRFSFSSSPGISAIDKRVEHLPVQPHPEAALASQQATNAARPTAAANAFAKELQTSTSHRQPKPTKAGAKAVKLSMASLVVVVLGGFLAYHNLPGLSLHLADAKAGITASLPNYTPAGFHINRSIEAIPGQVTVGFQSNTDNRSYQVTQTQSDWTSSNLLDSFVKPTYGKYQTIQNAGKTIYLDGSATSSSTNATWVSNGLWYQVKGQANLSNGQLLNIINSL